MLQRVVNAWSSNTGMVNFAYSATCHSILTFTPYNANGALLVKDSIKILDIVSGFE